MQQASEMRSNGGLGGQTQPLFGGEVVRRHGLRDAHVQGSDGNGLQEAHVGHPVSVQLRHRLHAQRRRKSPAQIASEASNADACLSMSFTFFIVLLEMCCFNSIRSLESLRRTEEGSSDKNKPKWPSHVAEKSLK